MSATLRYLRAVALAWLLAGVRRLADWAGRWPDGWQ